MVTRCLVKPAALETPAIGAMYIHSFRMELLVTQKAKVSSHPLHIGCLEGRGPGTSQILSTIRQLNPIRP